jgi:antibiotic biosynthesis monooxygenase (ABM) superfamily enzyme
MIARRIVSQVKIGARSLSTIPVNKIASVLKLNVVDEPTALKFDAHVSKIAGMMKAHPGYLRANRYVCKSEWAYELSFIFNDIDSFKAWKECALRDDVHSTYLDALEDIGIKEENVYGGARVYDEIN